MNVWNPGRKPALNKEIRDISLDRKAGRILLNEELQLQRKVPVMLSFITPAVPSQGTNGSILLSAVDKSTRGVSLSYDASQVVPSFEKIVLKDEGLRETWGENIYRALLTLTQVIDSGKWMMAID